MEYYAQLVEFPRPSEAALVALLAAFSFLFTIAIGVEIFRRTKIRRLRADAEWSTARDIIAERLLTKPETQTLETLIKRYSSDHPLGAVTTRQGFDKCVAQVMAVSAKKDSREEFERKGGDLRDIRTRLGLDYIPIGHQIETTRDLHPGQWISIAKKNADKPKWFRTMVALVDEAYFYLTQHSSSDGLDPELSAGDTVRCRMWRDEDARYFFTTTVAVVETGPTLWRMTHTDSLRRDQAREHFRIHHDQAATIGIVNASADGNLDNVRSRPVVSKLRGRVTSLSAGGFAVVVQQPVSKQVLLRVPLELPHTQPMDVDARIISCEPISGGRYLVRAAFVVLDDEHRDKVAKYVSRRQQFKLSKAADQE